MSMLRSNGEELRPSTSFDKFLARDYLPGRAQQLFQQIKLDRGELRHFHPHETPRACRRRVQHRRR